MQREVQKYNLTFCGEIRDGHDRGQAMLRFGETLGIDEQKRIMRFFSGDLVTLRRNLSHDTARRTARKLRKAGLITYIEPITEADNDPAANSPLPPEEASTESVVEAPETPPTKPAPAPFLDRSARAAKPNLYSLRPFRNNAQVRSRASRARQVARGAAAVGLFAAVALLLLGIRYLLLPAPAPLPEITALATSEQGALTVVSAEQLFLHDRSGRPTTSIEAQAVSLSAFEHPVFYAGDELMVMGRAIADAPASPPALFRCVEAANECHQVLKLDENVTLLAATGSSSDGALFLLFASGDLQRFSASGELEAQVMVDLPAAPQLQLIDGLLYLSSAHAPGLSVLIPDRKQFGEQVDEILLLADGAQDLSARVGMFIRSGGHWWSVVDKGPEGQSLQRFAADFTFLGQQPVGDQPLLVSWQDKALLGEVGSEALQRVNAAGEFEAPLEATSFLASRDAASNARTRQNLFWGIGFALLASIAAGAFVLAGVQHLRSLVYRHGEGNGAGNLDQYADLVNWVRLNPGRDSVFHRFLRFYAITCTVVLIAAVALKISVLGLAGLLLICIGPAAALIILARSPGGHIGRMDDQLLLVDHSGTYHWASGARIHYRSHFLLIDDVVVYLGNRHLPLFDPVPLNEIVPLINRGIKIQRRAVVVRLLQARHPLIKAAATCGGCVISGGLLVSAALLVSLLS